MTNNNEEDKEIENRLNKRIKAMGSIKNILKAKEVSRGAKITMDIHNALTRYPYNIFSLTRKKEKKMEVWGRQMLTSIF